ncbi:tyrosine-protein kinase wzc [mine drainage metagenome]|uniref:Tyrosine-protein kinase wzc n=1 Tax=mine drainage metagenome TaxID=410659 RepID=A0A1J5P8J2_9ZZZZ
MPPFVDLSLLSAGPTPPNPQELLGHPLFNSLLSYVNHEFDVVLIDTPPAIEYADSATIAMHCSGALVVTRQNKSRLQETRQMTDGLAQLGVPIVGAVLNSF